MQSDNSLSVRNRTCDHPDTSTELIGVHNCNPTTLTIDRPTSRLLSDRVRSEGRMIISEKGMHSADDIHEMKPYCDAFLIGSSIMAHERPEKKPGVIVCA